MKTLWRISNHADLDGLGGRKFSSRWTSIGRRVVYMAESPAGAMLEILAHLEFEDGDEPDEYQLIEIDVSEELGVQELQPPPGKDWREQPELTQQIGDRWLESLETPLARVPSAVMPRTWNILLNPEHSDAKKVKIVEAIREPFDNRLFHFGER